MEGVTRTRVIDGTHVQHLKEMHTFADNAPCMEVMQAKEKSLTALVQVLYRYRYTKTVK